MGKENVIQRNASLLLLCVAKVSIVGKIYRELIANVCEFYTCEPVNSF